MDPIVTKVVVVTPGSREIEPRFVDTVTSPKYLTVKMLLGPYFSVRHYRLEEGYRGTFRYVSAGSADFVDPKPGETIPPNS